MLKSAYLYFLIFIFFGINVMAQSPSGYVFDAANFSKTTSGGTARFQGLAGAGTALGADLTSASLNPAGLGFYRKSDVSFTGGLGFINSSSLYLDESNTDKRSYLFFPNLGVAISQAKD